MHLFCFGKQSSTECEMTVAESNDGWNNGRIRRYNKALEKMDRTSAGTEPVELDDGDICDIQRYSTFWLDLEVELDIWYIPS